MLVCQVLRRQQDQDISLRKNLEQLLGPLWGRLISAG